MSSDIAKNTFNDDIDPASKTGRAGITALAATRVGRFLNALTAVCIAPNWEPTSSVR